MKLSDLRASWEITSTALLAEALDEEGFESRVMPYVEEMVLRCDPHMIGDPEAISQWDLHDLADWIEAEVDSEIIEYLKSATRLESCMMDHPYFGDWEYEDIAEAYVEMYYAQPCESFRAMDFGRKPAEYRRCRR